MSAGYWDADEPSLTHTLGCASWDSDDADDCDCAEAVHLAEAPTMARALEQAFGETA